jgi:hypothetical protein
VAIKKVGDTMTPSLGKIKLEVAKLPKAAYNFFVQETPRKSGNARKQTKLRGNTISADYPYARKLDKGSSKQAPRGMTEPTIDYIERIAKQKIRK